MSPFPAVLADYRCFLSRFELKFFILPLVVGPRVEVRADGVLRKPLSLFPLAHAGKRSILSQFGRHVSLSPLVLGF